MPVPRRWVGGAGSEREKWRRWAGGDSGVEWSPGEAGGDSGGAGESWHMKTGKRRNCEHGNIIRNLWGPDPELLTMKAHRILRQAM